MNFEYSPEILSAIEDFTEFCGKEIAPAAADLDRANPEEARKIIKENTAKLVRRNYTGINLPASLGGSGKTLLDSLPFHEELARSCPSTFISIESSAGMAARLLIETGTDPRKDEIVSAVIRGESIGACAVTEAGAGSDVMSIETTARKMGGGWLLNGSKAMITNVPDADFIMVLALVEPEEGDSQPGFFLVPAGTSGLSQGDPLETMGLRGASLGDILLENCMVPGDALLGEAGAGFILHEKVETEGRIRLAAFSAGISAACLDLSLRHALKRKIRGKPIYRNQEVSFKIADMHTMLDTSRQLTRYAAWLFDGGSREAAVIASSAKLFAGESAVRTAHMTQQVFGGAGYLRSNDTERLYRDARFCEIGKGTSEIQRMLIADNVLKSAG